MQQWDYKALLILQCEPKEGQEFWSTNYPDGTLLEVNYDIADPLSGPTSILTIYGNEGRELVSWSVYDKEIYVRGEFDSIVGYWAIFNRPK